MESQSNVAQQHSDRVVNHRAISLRLLKHGQLFSLCPHPFPMAQGPISLKTFWHSHGSKPCTACSAALVPFALSSNTSNPELPNLV